MKCDNCHESTEAFKVKVGLVKYEQWCDVCPSFACSRCDQMASRDYGYEINTPSDNVFICGSCIIEWACDEKHQMLETLKSSPEFEAVFGDPIGQLDKLTIRGEA